MSGGAPTFRDPTGKNMSKKKKRTTALISPTITFVLVFILAFLLIANAGYMDSPGLARVIFVNDMKGSTARIYSVVCASCSLCP
jgi:hypothetical protein